MAAVSTTTRRVRFSAEEVSPQKLCSCCHTEISVVCIVSRRDKGSFGLEDNEINRFRGAAVGDGLGAHTN
jgi:hypothetical protein